ncbi:hypothetical protein [Dysosmobacter sp. HCP28S3_G4]|uniref:hypothetical protein n=1 Tax=Dysosmobacter sp. HCP28S3_G4 TaxID=3438938 RepID=UPI003F8A5E82
MIAEAKALLSAWKSSFSLLNSYPFQSHRVVQKGAEHILFGPLPFMIPDIQLPDAV